MNTIQIPCRPGEVSDGYHTFDELYEHRGTLFLALMSSMPGSSWISLTHDDGSAWPGWFIAGLNLPTGNVTYHLPMDMWSLALDGGIQPVEKAPKWDGHTSSDVVKRIQAWVSAIATPAQPSLGNAGME